MPTTTRSSVLNSTLVNSDGSWKTYDTHYMVSQGNNVRLLGTGDQGGDWLLNKVTDSATSNYHQHVHIFGYDLFGQSLISGIYPGTYNPYLGPISEPDTTALLGKGTTAIARSLPTNPYEKLADAIAQQIGVALPGIVGHELWRDKALTAKNAGSEYLNVEFGWLPMIGDIRKTAHAIKHQATILRNFQRGSGKKTRRGYHFPPEITTSYEDVTLEMRSWNGGRQSPGKLFQKQHTDTWFNGCFTYYVPEGDSRWEKLARHEAYANKLLGLRITPEILWDATPWTWMADWFGNVGDVLHNLGAFTHDGLVMQYGYIMETKRLHAEFSVDDVTNEIFARRTIHSVWKKRLRATPYGFSVNLNSLSASQIAILVALGLSKGLPGHGA